MVDIKKKSTLGIIAIVLGVVSFIPLIGLIIGLAAIVVGIIAISKDKSKMGVVGLVLGILGILLTIGLYGSLFYFGFMQRGGVYDDLRTKMVQDQQLPNTINALESFKARFGKYPDKIEDLKQISNDPWIYTDQLQAMQNVKIATQGTGSQINQSYFYYENRGETYVLFSKGVDGIPFTQDDVFPIFNESMGKLGYVHP